MAIVAAICLGVLGSLIAYGLVQAYKGYEDNEDVLGLLRRLSQKFPKRVKRKAHSQYRYIVYLREPYEDNFAEVDLTQMRKIIVWEVIDGKLLSQPAKFTYHEFFQYLAVHRLAALGKGEEASKEVRA